MDDDTARHLGGERIGSGCRAIVLISSQVADGNGAGRTGSSRGRLGCTIANRGTVAEHDGTTGNAGSRAGLRGATGVDARGWDHQRSRTTCDCHAAGTGGCQQRQRGGVIPIDACIGLGAIRFNSGFGWSLGAGCCERSGGSE